MINFKMGSVSKLETCGNQLLGADVKACFTTRTEPPMGEDLQGHAGTKAWLCQPAAADEGR